ncbi:MAG: outer membrane beta-barrel protein [Planctomycetes bacterium]|nr:outer membrane beta-barrel protein [Planctomycetota bacterium]
MRRALSVLVPSVLMTACAVTSEASYPTAERTAVPAEAADPTQDAAGKYGPEPGQSLLQFGGALTSQKTDAGAGGSSTDTSLTLQGGIGWFQNEWLELGGQLLTNYSDSGFTLISVAPYANYNHKVNERVWVYGGPHVGLAYLDFSSDDAISLEFGVHGGTRYWVDPRTSVFGELRYTHAKFDLSPNEIDSDTFQLLFGFTVVF